MLVNAGMSSRRPSTVPSGRSAKASSVGAISRGPRERGQKYEHENR